MLLTHVLSAGVFAQGIAVDGSGNVYVTGFGSDNAFKITPGGVITEIIDSTGDSAGNTLDGSFGIAVDGSGNVYVTGWFSDNAFKITPGGVITQIIFSILGDLFFTAGVAVDGSENVYVTGQFSDNVFKITPGGVITQIIDDTGDGAGNTLLEPVGIAVDSAGNVYVAGASTDNAFKITPSGVITQIIDATGDSTGNMLSEPVSIAVDGSGNVYVTGLNSNNAFKITVGCLTNGDCDDSSACTTDVCEVNGTCSNENNFDDAVFCCNPADGALTAIDDSNDCTGDVCDSGTGQVSHTPAVAGSPCDDPSNSQCDNPDTCDGTGTCLPNSEPPGLFCGNPTDSECDNPDTCDGLGTCLANFEPVDTPCDDSDSCTTPDVCDMLGSCLGSSRPECASSRRIVDADATGANDGTSWINAYTFLQEALIDAAGAGGAVSEIWVAAGTYTPDDQSCLIDTDCAGGANTCSVGGECEWSTPRTQTFQLLDGVGIYGGFDGTETLRSQRDIALNVTILSGDIDDDDIFGDFPNGATFSDNSLHVVKGAGTNSTAVLDGFTITGGNANGDSAFRDDDGGGMFNSSSSPTVANCIFNINSATDLGGAMVNDSGSSPTIESCVFEVNAANTGGGMGSINSSQPTVTDCEFVFNGSAGTINSGGAAFVGSGSSMNSTRTRFLNNTANSGGGVFSGASTSVFVNCEFVGNEATFFGGGLFNNVNADVSLVNTRFVGNTAPNGAAINNSNTSSPTLTNCTIANNTATGSGGGIRNDGTGSNSPVLTNCILWNNSDSGGTDESAQIHTDSGTPVVNFSVVQGGWSGAGSSNIITTDPLFVDGDGADDTVGTEDDDLRLGAGSPAIDAGDNTSVPLDAADVDGDGDFAEQVPLDGNGDNRFNDDPLTVDTGNGFAPIVDMGAFEVGGSMLFVDADATGSASGLSWGNAFVNLQDALVVAEGGNVTEIWVAGGTYTPNARSCTAIGDCGAGASACTSGLCEWTTPREQTFQLQNGVGLYGGFAGNESSRGSICVGGVNDGAACQTDPDCPAGVCAAIRDFVVNETILSGDINGDDAPVACAVDSPDCDSNGGKCLASGSCIVPNSNGENSYHVVTGSGTSSSAVLDGFMVSAGNADGIDPDDSGGGMLNNAGSPTVTNCTFNGNTADIGGGMLNDGVSNPTVTNCTFSQNSAGSVGGGMANNNNCSPTVTNCTFSDNSAGSVGGGMYNVTSSNPTLTNCTFNGNSAGFDGGGMFIFSSSPTLTNCTFSGNVAGSDGGGMFIVLGSIPTVTNCTFSGNSATNGGAIANEAGGNPMLTNSTFSGNSASTSGGGIFNGGSGINNPLLTNCVLWDNSDIGGTDESAQIHTLSGTPVVNYSVVQGGWTGSGGVGIVTTDPMFVDADGADNIAGTEDDNLRLQALSPAIDAGDNSGVTPDVLDLDGDGEVSEGIPFDLDDNNRFFDDPLTVDSGNGTAPIVDMGAYEFGSGPSQLFVSANATGVGDGTSWTDAYVFLQDALVDATASGAVSQIWVAAGTYNPTEQGCGIVGDCVGSGGASACTAGLCVWNLPREQTFQLLSGVSIVGGFAGGETSVLQRNVAANETILSGDIDGDDTPVVCVVDSPDCDMLGGRCVEGTCIIADNNAENSYRVVTGSGTVATSVLDGFTITAGNADGACCGIANSGGGMYNSTGSPTVTNCTFRGNTSNLSGGGMHNESGSDPTVTNCTFSGNSSNSGGGMQNIVSNPTVTYCSFTSNSATFGGGMRNSGSSPTVTNCTFSENSAEIGGGGMFSAGGSPTVTNCTFSGNTASSFAGGMLNQSNSPIVTNCTFSGNSADSGGGILNDGSSPTVANCTFSENSAEIDGGGMFSAGGSPTVTNCTFSGNVAGSDGGGMFIALFSIPTVTNCTFSGNSATNGGGIANDTGGSPMLTNCTFIANLASNTGGGIFNGGSGSSNPTLTNCILWNNSDAGGTDESAQIHTDSGTPVVNHSVVQGGWGGSGGVGVIDADPLFVNASNGDLRLLPGSPARDAGDNSAVPADTLDLDDDLNTTEAIPFDLNGDPRFQDDAATVDTGVGTPPIVDMGAFEQRSSLIFVDEAATGGNDDGSSWADAFLSLQDALADAAGAGVMVDEIWVAAGTYTPDEGAAQTPFDRSATFQLISGVGLFGGFAGGETLRSQRDPAVNVTILSGDLNFNDAPLGCLADSPDCDSNGGLCRGSFCIIGSNNGENSFHVTTGSGTNSTAVLDGFTITAGNADEVTPPNNQGGGMFSQSGSPSVSNCIITGNSAGFTGGGVFNNNNSNPTMRNVTISSNVSNTNGGGMYNANGSSPLLSNCIFEANHALFVGGGLFHVNNSDSIVINTRFSGNVSVNRGGAVWVDLSSPTFTNCLFSGNFALSGGAVANNDDSEPSLVNCTLSNNSANDVGGGIHNTGPGPSNPTLDNCILWGNVDDADGNAGGPFSDESAQIHTDIGAPVVNFSVVQGGWSGLGGAGIVTSDPMFADADGVDDIVGTADDDLRLLVLPLPSPAIDAGDNDALPLDATDLDGDGITIERLPLDLLGNLRLADIFLVIDIGNGIAPIVDMGAQETFRECNDNGTDDAIDIADLTSLDCNGSGVPDECEIDLGGGAPGGPFFCSTDCDPDCNANGIPDSCDITDLTSTDCNSNGVPDECDPDCNENNIPDQCDITSLFSTDCNSNGIPDQCDITSLFSADCNSNGIPDACDILNCPAGTAACDDCDLSGVPDSCEVPAPGGTCTVGCLADSNGDGVPDKCASFTGSGAMNDTLWSNANNWDIGGGVIPDNVGGAAFSVSANAPPPPPGELFAALAVTTIDLDLNVAIDSLRVGSGVLLNMQSTSADNLTIETTGGLVNEGDIMLANDRKLDVSAGPVTIGAGGKIEADPLAGATNCAGGQVCASLDAVDLALVGSTSADCGALRGGGELSLRGDMSATVSGNLILAGSASNSCAALMGAAASSSAFRGITPSPKWRLVDDSLATISGSIILTDSVETTNTSTDGALLCGSFDNQSTSPSEFDWDTGTLTMDGTAGQQFEAAESAIAGQQFEVAGLDLGPFPEGFSTTRATLFMPVVVEPHSNYSIGTLVIATDADVTFENTFANTAGAGPCEEALYVNELVLEAGSTIQLRDVRVYYNTLVDNGSTRVFIGCGKLVEVTCTDNAVSDDCVGATTITDGITAFDNTCASVDGLSSIECETGGQRIGSDVWYRYTATCTGLMDVSLCGSADFDAGLSVFQDPLDPTLCPCPADTSTQDGLCADDTCDEVAGASEIERGVQQGDCYLIRMGGIVGDFGTGDLEITCVPLGCTSSQSLPPVALQVEATGGGTGALTATRTLNFTIPNLGGLTSAIRIELKEIPPALLASNPPGNIPDSFLGLVGAQMWVGTDPGDPTRPDTQALCSVPSVGFGGVCPPGVPTIRMTALSQTASMLDWSTQGELHIYGSTVGAGANFIIPGAVYEVTVLVEGCDPEDPASFSPPLTLAGSVPGDIVGVYDATSGVWTIPGDGASITTDVLALLQAFKGVSTAPNKARMDIQGTNAAQRAQLDGIIGLNDVNDGIDGFKGRLYRFGPGLCTGGFQDGKRGCDPDDAGSRCVVDGGACAFDCPAVTCPNAP